jgi:hypothetical protein
MVTWLWVKTFKTLVNPVFPTKMLLFMDAHPQIDMWKMIGSDPPFLTIHAWKTWMEFTLEIEGRDKTFTCIHRKLLLISQGILCLPH